MLGNYWRGIKLLLCDAMGKTAVKRSVLLFIQVVNMRLYPTQTVKLVKLPEANEGRHQVD